MKAHIVRESQIAQSWRVENVRSMFDVPAAASGRTEWDVTLPVEDKDWQIGLVVGPSGSGKTTLLHEMFGVPEAHSWDPGAAVLDGFPKELSTKEVVGLLSSVGFSSPPSWLRPYGTLSNGEQFRVDLARALAQPGRALIDEFTSVVDRTVAQIACAAVAKHIRRSPGRQLVASACHYDIEDWLQPDWLYDTGSGSFTWRSVLPRPRVELEVYRTTVDAWRFFRRHHYLTGEHSKSAACYIGLINGQAAAWCSVIPQPISSGKKHDGMWRLHRSVCLPDYQGIGVGSQMAETIAAVWRAVPGYRVRAITNHPAMIAHRLRSPHWKLVSAPRIKEGKGVGIHTSRSGFRATSTFESVIAPAPLDTARALLPPQHAAKVRERRPSQPRG